MNNHNKSRRSFIKKAAYIAPVVLTLKAGPTMACGFGSGPSCQTKSVGNQDDDHGHRTKLSK